VDLNFDGNFTECGNPSQPGVQAHPDYLKSLHTTPIQTANGTFLYDQQ